VNEGHEVKRISDVINEDNFIQLPALGINGLYLKLEGLNPAGSIKLKTALSMVSQLENAGAIGPGTRLIESSSGSLGVALSMVCAERGYRFSCVVDPNASPDNVKTMKVLGADVVLVDQRDANGGFLGSRIAYIQALTARDPCYVWLNQYANPENPGAHARTTARAIAAAFEHIDYLFVGAGTTGTLMGCVQYFSAHRPDTRIVAVDSVGSVTFGLPPGKRHIPGLGTSRTPEIFSSQGVHAFEMVAERDTVAMCRFLAQSCGLLAGGSTGTVLTAVHQWRDRFAADDVVVTISPDLGERYLSTIYDDCWVRERFNSIPTLSLASALRDAA
jgi:N-(2-amino-2-carboxyethyl)-L-glutamate synthase